MSPLICNKCQMIHSLICNQLHLFSFFLFKLKASRLTPLASWCRSVCATLKVTNAQFGYVHTIRFEKTYRQTCQELS